MHIISFPGLGIGPFSIDPVAFSVFSRDIRWYGIIIMTGILLATLYAIYRANQNNISTDSLLDFVIFVVPSGIICARLYYVLTNLESYRTFYDAIAIWNGGIAIYGAVIGGIIAIVLVAKFKKIKLPLILDIFAPAVMIGQLIGRWGNFVNAEAYGILNEIDLLGFKIATPSFTDNYIFRMVIENPGNGSVIAVHPTFLYESLWNLLGFIIINAYFNKKKFDGEITLMYLSWYGLGRFFIEGLRGDSLYVGQLRISQLLGLVCFVAGVITLIVLHSRAKKRAERLDEYLLQFPIEKGE